MREILLNIQLIFNDIIILILKYRQIFTKDLNIFNYIVNCLFSLLEKSIRVLYKIFD